MTSFLTIYDLLLTPIYLILISIFAIWFKQNHLKDPILKKHFLPALYLKIFGAISLGLIYEFYYDGGDTSMYYKCILEVCTDFYYDPFSVFQFIFDPESSPQIKNVSLGLYRIREDTASLMVVRIGVLFSIFSFNTYSVIATFMGLITFTGVWKLYTWLYKRYPLLEKELAISLFYMPSIFFWGSGLMKDGLTLSALCFAFYSLASFLLVKRKMAYIIILLSSLYVLFSIKIYIVICFIPTAIFWIFSTFNHKIKNKLVRSVAAPVMLFLGLSLGFFTSNEFSKTNKKYNFETLIETSKVTSTYIGRISLQTGGSYYSLGDYEPTLTGILPKVPAAIWVALFRPYIWEVKNVAMLLSALECAFFLWLTLLTVYKAGLFKFIKTIRLDPFLQFAILFSLMFSFAVGISTNNFGTLVRYKIPMMPFYLSAIFIIKSKFDKKKH